MTVTQPLSITLEEFLKQAEMKPASEYIDGTIVQKPIPKTRHTRLQGKLMQAINEVTESQRLAYAFPELRCTFGERSIIPDIAVLRWEKIALDNDEELLDDILIAPSWTIEILSPHQSSNRVTGNILHCLKHGCELGWLVDPEDRSVIVFQPQQQPECLHQGDLEVLKGIALVLTVEELFSWLQMA